MNARAVNLLLLSTVVAGCAQVARHSAPSAPSGSHYHAVGFEWSSVRRILLVPLVNESASPRISDELRAALATELQSAGHFEIILAPSDIPVTCSENVRVHGRFDEAELIELANRHQVDGILLGTVTQYQPYAPPRIGLSLRLISPSEAVVIASQDGVWDARDKPTAERAKSYGLETSMTGQSLLGGDLVLTSPHLFQRFVCHEAAQGLMESNSRMDAVSSSARNGLQTAQ